MQRSLTLHTRPPWWYPIVSTTQRTYWGKLLTPHSLDKAEDKQANSWHPTVLTIHRTSRQTADTPQSWPSRGQADKLLTSQSWPPRWKACKLLTPYSLDQPEDKQANCWHPTVLTIQRASRQTADTSQTTPPRGYAEANSWHLTFLTTQRASRETG